MRAAAADDRPRRSQQECEIREQVLVLDVPEVHLHPLGEADLVAAADLSQAAQAGPHGQSAESAVELVALFFQVRAAGGL